MREFIRGIVGRFYPLFNPIWKAYYLFRRKNALHHSVDGGIGDDIFGEIYRKNLWNSPESVSGAGSTLWQTAPIRRTLPRIIAKYGVRTLLDAPCGDFNWMRKVDLGPVDYIGADLVPELVANLQANYADPRHRFIVRNIARDAIPDAELWMCRDVLFHLTNADALSVLKQFAASNITYFLSTTYPYCPENIDLERSGGFRTINLCRAPFNLPPPRDRFDDFVAPYTPRILGLWTRQQVRTALEI